MIEPLVCIWWAAFPRPMSAKFRQKKKKKTSLANIEAARHTYVGRPKCTLEWQFVNQYSYLTRVDAVIYDIDGGAILLIVTTLIRRWIVKNVSRDWTCTISVTIRDVWMISHHSGASCMWRPTSLRFTVDSDYSWANADDLTTLTRANCKVLIVVSSTTLMKVLSGV